MAAVAVLGLALSSAPVAADQAADRTAIAELAFPGALELVDGWRLNRGDDPRWAAPVLDVAPWREVELTEVDSDAGGAGGDTVWLRRRVELPQSWRDRLAPTGLVASIEVGASGTYTLYAGGERLGTIAGADLSFAGPRLRIFPIPEAAVGASGELVLALRYHQRPALFPGAGRRSGPLFARPPLLGDRETLAARARGERLRAFDAGLPSMVLAALLAAVGIYHLQLFARRRESREYLWFGLAALNFAVMTVLFYQLGELLFDYATVRRLVAVSAHLVLVWLIQFLWTFFARPISRPWRAYQLSHVALAVFVLLVPYDGWITVTNPWRLAWGLPGWVGMLVLLSQEVWRKRLEARIISLGAFAVMVAGGGEWLAQMNGWGTTFPVPVWAAMLFAISMTTSLSDRFNRVHDELEGLRFQLEQMVEDRTHELKIANEKLQSEIAERQLAQEAMRMLERAVEQSIDGILVFDLDGNVQFLNEAWAGMHGYEAFEMPGRDIALFHTAEQMAAEVQPTLERVRREGLFDGEIGHCRKDGSTFPAWMSLTLLRGEGGEEVGFVAVGRDISERRKAEEEQTRLESKVQHAKKLESLGDLAGGIAHDYNNLLTGVLGNSDLVLRELPADSPAREKIRQIQHAAERAADLASQLLAYAGEDPLALRSLRLNDLVSEMRDELVEMVPSRVELRFDPTDELPSIAMDPAQIRRAIRNLVTNASEALGGEPGVITVATSCLDVDRQGLAGAYLEEGHEPGTFVRLAVSDTGSGIGEEARARMFDPFFSTRVSARGLGLATVFGIVRAHRGVIRVHTRLGAGTTLELLFPLAIPDAGIEPVPEPPAFHRFAGSGTILVVDDEALMREVSESILEESGFQVLTAADGREAVRLYRSQHDKIRLVLLDRTMPVMDGEQVLDEIFRLDAAARIVLMSGYKEKEVMRDLADKGLAGFLQKPFRPDELLRKVQEVLAE